MHQAQRARNGQGFDCALKTGGLKSAIYIYGRPIFFRSGQGSVDDRRIDSQNGGHSKNL
jgi:hypothetical protein